MPIKLIRHGQSEANTRVRMGHDVGDANVMLTEHGWQQARAAGAVIGADFLQRALVYCSPYQRTRDTLKGLIEGAGLQANPPRIFEDPRLREVEHGVRNPMEQAERYRTHGAFWYRFEGGESAADCFDRLCTFFESLTRQCARKQNEDVLIVSHGMAMRCFVMRYLHLSVEQFEQIKNPLNTAIITIDRREHLTAPVFTSGRWGVEGIVLREATAADSTTAP